MDQRTGRAHQRRADRHRVPCVELPTRTSIRPCYVQPECQCVDHLLASTGFREPGSATRRRRSIRRPGSARRSVSSCGIKRDDCTGLAFGGNKVRQLEFHLGEAQARGADTVLVTGAVQSNLVRLAAAGARRLGMDAHGQLEERVDGAGALYRASGNLLLDQLLGATLRAFPVGEDEAAADAALERRARALADEGRRPVRDPFGPRASPARRTRLRPGRRGGGGAGPGARRRVRRGGLRLGQRAHPRRPPGRVGVHDITVRCLFRRRLRLVAPRSPRSVR